MAKTIIILEDTEKRIDIKVLKFAGNGEALGDDTPANRLAGNVEDYLHRVASSAPTPNATVMAAQSDARH
jgi:hypothetical protein